jgi:hypothetical protein
MILPAPAATELEVTGSKPSASVDPCAVCRAKADASRLLSMEALADCTLRVTIGRAVVDSEVRQGGDSTSRGLLDWALVKAIKALSVSHPAAMCIVRGKAPNAPPPRRSRPTQTSWLCSQGRPLSMRPCNIVVALSSGPRV